MKEKYTNPCLIIDELEKNDVLCNSKPDNDTINYNDEQDSLLRTIGEFFTG